MQLTTSPATSVLENIKTRRTVRDFTDRAVPDSVLHTILDAAVWAPNHRMTEPWRFYVLGKSGEARQRAADLTHDWTLHNIPNQNQAQSSADAVRAEMLAAPALIYVYSLSGGSAEIDEENYSATSCAVQNLMLAAHAHGLGVGWSTGKPTRHPGVTELLGAEPDSKIVGCLYIGYPAAVPQSKRQDASDVTRWL